MQKKWFRHLIEGIWGLGTGIWGLAAAGPFLEALAGLFKAGCLTFFAFLGGLEFSNLRSIKMINSLKMVSLKEILILNPATTHLKKKQVTVPMDLQPPWSWWWLIDTERFWMWMAVIMADQVFWQCADFDNPQNMCVSLTWVFSSLDPVLNWSRDKVESLQGAQPSETETLLWLPLKHEGTKTGASEYVSVFLIVSDFATSSFQWKSWWFWMWMILN